MSLHLQNFQHLLRRSKMPEETAINAYVKEFQNNKGLKRMKIIKNDGELLDFRK